MRLLCCCLLIWTTFCADAANQPEFSTAGFFPLENTGRSSYSMNPAWRFHKGTADGAERPDYDDTAWNLVSLPDGMEYLPTEASGCINYQGESWYRKHFTPRNDWKGKQLFLHFEAIMGQSKVWINGQLVQEHFGGFLPVIADVTPYLKYGEDNVIAVWADNSNNENYPPGKPQDMLDFAYFGGIYRDCWMIVHNKVFITDPNYENETAGGGLFVSYDKVSEQSAEIRLDAHLRNLSDQHFRGKLCYELYSPDKSLVKRIEKSFALGHGKARSVTQKLTLDTPDLWSPDHPALYQLHVKVKDLSGQTVDGFRKRIGVRSVEFKGKDGFWLNGKPYKEPMIGANRHQDFAVIGNALSNSLHWRDAKKLRNAGLRVIRNAHYPQDPAFMDACDELGLFVIVNTPGWQFWNDAPIFGQRVYNDIRNMIRRDRNHPSVWMWEPILNETWYPDDFAKNVVTIVHEEYPYPYCAVGCDMAARGHEYFPIQFTHPANGDQGYCCTDKDIKPEITYFTREWGDNVDDWNSHNSPSRVSRAWGEHAMLQQAQGYARPPYPYTCYDALYRTSPQHIGGCLWHSFDHQRGYHPDPFYGGIMDMFRQPKLSYYMFCAQRPVQADSILPAEKGPMVYIAHTMTPFSPEDVTIYSNCDEVRLTTGKDGKQRIYRKDKQAGGMPSPIITFKKVWNVMDDKALSRDGKQADSYLLAEGLTNGKVVASHLVKPARRPSRLRLWTDDENLPLKGDGSDLITVIAAVTDDEGHIKRLNNSIIRFEIEGDGELVANQQTQTNPRTVQWGTAPVLVRAKARQGTIRIKASTIFEGIHTPASAELVIQTHPADYPQIADTGELEKLLQTQERYQTESDSNHQADAARLKELQQQSKSRLKEVEKQQSDFE